MKERNKSIKERKLDDKKEYFKNNNRMAMMLRLLEKIPSEDLAEIKARAGEVLLDPDSF